MKTLKELNEAIVPDLKLTDQEYLGLGIYLGYKSSYRRGEFSRYDLDYDAFVKRMSELNLIRNGRIDKKVAKLIFDKKFAGQSPSQVHQYIKKLEL